MLESDVKGAFVKTCLECRDLQIRTPQKVARPMPKAAKALLIAVVVLFGYEFAKLQGCLYVTM